jgi:hypothetical protein
VVKSPLPSILLLLLFVAYKCQHASILSIIEEERPSSNHARCSLFCYRIFTGFVKTHVRIRTRLSAIFFSFFFRVVRCLANKRRRMESRTLFLTKRIAFFSFAFSFLHCPVCACVCACICLSLQRIKEQEHPLTFF